ncbi:MAG: pantoate--beta-alanine ligase [Austwickia sp.]|nr:pantoate--beta-alanine ligase [Austwickia sp.]MBK9101451.1 pantoate--beta-alanine ligase [Austwickia sp.]
MKVVRTRGECAQARAELGLGTTVGFVPTMGYLHEGHLSLVRRAKTECAAAVASIFVNPTQFGPTEDLSTYPRDLDGDLAVLEEAGCDVAWLPEVADIYPPGFSTFVDVEGVTAVLEGARRPGHFRGVATVVAILLNVVRPTRAYFGQKDAQQTVVLRRMIEDLALGVDMVVAPTVREPDGLAMSSRNSYLDPAQRAAAVVLHRAMQATRTAYAGGERDADRLRTAMTEVIAGEPLAEPDYVSVADPRDLTELTVVDPAVGALASLAVRIGRTRLIDNELLF